MTSEDKLKKLIEFTDSVMIVFRNYYAQAITRAQVDQKLEDWRKLKKELNNDR